MKYLFSCISCVMLLSVIVFSATQAQEEEVVVDRGYECFNLEIAQAQLQSAREQGDKREIRQARISVKNWKKLCK